MPLLQKHLFVVLQMLPHYLYLPVHFYLILTLPFKVRKKTETRNPITTKKEKENTAHINRFGPTRRDPRIGKKKDKIVNHFFFYFFFCSDFFLVLRLLDSLHAGIGFDKAEQELEKDVASLKKMLQGDNFFFFVFLFRLFFFWHRCVLFF